MRLRLHEVLFLKPGELSRGLPFFGFYLVLFGAFSLADGLSLALFVSRVGAERLPAYYGFSALANLVLIGVYVLNTERLGPLRTFQVILGATAALYGCAWAALQIFETREAFYGALFVGREVGYTLVLLHFGAVLQEFFNRDELNRVLPVIYAGGRAGGIAGGAILTWLSGPIGVLNLAPVFVGLCALCMLMLVRIGVRVPRISAPEDWRQDGAPTDKGSATNDMEARHSLRGFLHYVWSSRLLFWLSITSVLFMTERWVLNYQYSAFFQAYFGDTAKLAEFVGSYTQIALVVSLVVQLVLVNRLVARIGLGGAYLTYGVLVVIAAAVNVFPMTLGLALFCRLVETELRFGLRNPLSQLLSNQFSKPLRTRVRAWTMGLLTPLGAGAAFIVLSGLQQTEQEACVPWVGISLSAMHLIGSLAVCTALRSASGLGPDEKTITSVPRTPCDH